MAGGRYQQFFRSKKRFLHWVDRDLGDFLWKKSMNRKLKKRMRGQQKLSGEDRQKVINYWKKYTVKFEAEWIQFYSLCHGKWDVRYIPDDLYYTTIDRHLNSQSMGRGLGDKNYLSKIYPDARQPLTLIRKINGFIFNAEFAPLSEAEAVRLCQAESEWVIKPSADTHGGANIVFGTKGESILPLLRSGENLIVQKPIRQHDVMAKLHARSVNTLRMTTLLMDGKATMLSALVRMGVGGKRVDNAWAGGISCGIQENGRLKHVAYAIDGKRFDVHPQGAVFEECVIPNYNTFVELAKTLQEQTAHNRLVSWDFVVGEDGNPILLEANLWYGGSMVHQYCNGPLFGDLTEAVLDEVYGRKESDHECI